ncbi:hypothetical protein EVAR_63070_1 [Eumeta japonica]|uniref:Uncharacterized protein n=1 Tax=Eumeta variegata TaxID=151549 RepID=A0A4C1Z9W0_EUMVA|nr:hypothetical protein EVAR_63070_1 [Eumeta japonica]
MNKLNKFKLKGVPPGSLKGQGAKSLPLGELKLIFFNFLVSQRYAVPEEAEAIFGTNQSNANNREPSPSPSVCSSKRSSSAVSSEESDKSDETIKSSRGETEDEREFIKVRRKPRKVARRQNPNRSDSTDLTNMEVDKNKGAPTVKINTSTSTNSS